MNFLQNDDMKHVYHTQNQLFGGKKHLSIKITSQPELYIKKGEIVKISVLGIPISYEDLKSQTI